MSKALVLNGTNFATNKVATITFGEAVPCTGITLDESTKSVTSMSAFTLTATPAPSNTTDSVYWSSSDDNVATVANGVVTPVCLGTATITATCGSYSATCAVTIDNVVVPYKAVCGYNPYKRSNDHPALTVDKKSSATSEVFIIAADQATGLYPIESKDNVDTSPYRFVPLMIPAGATKVTITTSLGSAKIKTRMLYIDSTRSSADSSYPNDAAYCLQGSTGGYDQGSTTATPLAIDLPTNLSGMDSLCIAIIIGGTLTTESNGDYTSDISVVFSYGE